MADILLTGATGLLGSRLLVDLAPENNVTALSRRRPDKANPDLRWVSHDLARPVLPDGLPPADVVIHLAQSRHFREFPNRANDIFAVNAGSTALLLSWARTTGARQFILASSGGVYCASHSPVQEDAAVSVTGLASFYAASKLASESIAFSYRNEFTVAILRFFFIYGPGQDRGMLIPRIIESAAAGRPIRLQGSEGLRINPIYVADASIAVVACLGLSESTILNVAGPETLSLRTIAELVGTHLGVPPKFDVSHEPPPASRIADISRMTERLGPPTTRFASAVPELCQPS